MAILIKFVLFERTFKMIYKLPLQLFRILLGFRNKSTYFDQKKRAFRHLRYAFDSICIRHKSGKKRNFYLANHMSSSI